MKYKLEEHAHISLQLIDELKFNWHMHDLEDSIFRLGPGSGSVANIKCT
jgi:hypothetical protein